MKRVFLYARVSTEEQAVHGLSIEAQQTALEAWAKESGHKVVGLYVDAGISARKPASKRPALQCLLNDVRSGKGDMVVFTKLDRWFRSVGQYYQVQDVLEANGVSWRAIHEDYETATASGRLKVNIMLSVAQDEADRTSERIKAINAMKRERGEVLCGSTPFGYKIEGKKFIKDPDVEDAVTAFFQKYMSCASMLQTFDYLRENFGLKLGYQHAYKMLKSPCYYGHYFDTDGMTPPYITKEEYEKIQAIRGRAVKKSAKNRVYLFSGLIMCGECGCRMAGRINTKREVYHYNCSAHYIKANDCQNKTNLSERKIEAYIIETAREKLDQRKFEVEKVYALRKNRDYSGELSSMRSKLAKLKDLYLNDVITLEECKQEQAEYAARIEELEKEAAAQEKPDFEAAEKMLSDGWEVAYRALEKEQKREFWRVLIREIRICPDRHIEYDLNE